MALASEVISISQQPTANSQQPTANSQQPTAKSQQPQPTVFNFLKPKKKYTPQQNLAFLSADMHSHMLPGVDDGAQNIDEAVDMAKAYRKLGFQKVWLSPHINESFPNTTAELQERFQALKHTLGREVPQLEIHLAAEYKMDALFKERWAQKDLLTIEDQFLLIELPFLSAPMGWEEELFQLQMDGYKPILAHTERYIYLSDQFDTLLELPHRGIELQLNLLSLSGHYGQPARTLAERLLKHKAYKWVATDAHAARHLQKIESHVLPKWPQQLSNEQYQRNQAL